MFLILTKKQVKIMKKSKFSAMLMAALIVLSVLSYTYNMCSWKALLAS